MWLPSCGRWTPTSRSTIYATYTAIRRPVPPKPRFQMRARQVARHSANPLPKPGSAKTEPGVISDTKGIVVMSDYARGSSLLRRGRTRKPVVTVVLLTALATISACSSSSHDSVQHTTKDGNSSPAVQAARSEYLRFSKAQPPVSVPTLPSKPPTGLSFTIVTCALPVCHSETDPAANAAAKLGWRVRQLSYDVTPAGYQAVLDQLVADPPKVAAIVAPFPNKLIGKQLAALQRAGTKICEISPSDEAPTSNGPVQAVVVGPAQLAMNGRLMADVIVADDSSAPAVAFVTDPAIAPGYDPEISAFKKVILGAGGTVDMLDVSQANVGKTVPGQVVSYMQAHPKIKYMAFVFADYLGGVPQALAQAGLTSQVKIISRSPQQADLAAVRNGTEFAEIGDENTAGGYRMVDQLARLAMNISLGGLADPAGWHQIYIKSNAPVESTTPGVPSAFYKAWLLK